MGKKQIARHIPQPSYSSVRTPIRQFGQLPAPIMTGPVIPGIVMLPWESYYNILKYSCLKKLLILYLDTNWADTVLVDIGLPQLPLLDTLSRCLF